jgi:hypothetical protein
MAKSARQEGLGRDSTAGGSWTLSADDISRIIAKKMRNLQRKLKDNETAYINAKPRKGLTPENRYIVSGVGLTDHPQKFGWSWMPPAEACYQIWPKGKLRDWSWVMIHSFGYTWDYAFFGKNQGRIAPPGDQYGHHPARWMSAIQQLCALQLSDTRPPQSRASIHWCVSRRGDVLWSCGVNDLAYHGGGDVRIAKEGNNRWMVGCELEPALARYKQKNGKLSRPYILPYTDRQMLAQAIVLKKLETFQPNIEHFYCSKENGSIIAQAKAHKGGYIQHKDVFSKKVDANAQFDIQPGKRGLPGNPHLANYDSAWDTLWNMMAKMRFNLATDIFTKKLTDSEFQNVSDMSNVVMKTTNAGQRAIVSAQRDRVLGLQRAASMQAQDRRALYKQGQSHASTMNSIVAKGTAAVSQQAQAYAGKVAKVGGTIVTYSAETGLWSDEQAF